MASWISALAARLTSRWGARIATVVGVLLLVGVIGGLGSAEAPTRGAEEPPQSESAAAAALLAEFPNADRQSVLVVAVRADQGPLTPADREMVSALVPTLEGRSGSETRPPVISEDGHAALLSTSITVGEETAVAAEVVDGIRADVAATSLPGLEVYVTGGPAFGVDIAGAFAGADFVLLAVTISVVAILLIITYRSPVLWLIPLLVVALADQAANKVTAVAGVALDLHFDAGIISVLVFGAGTNYALLLISRYREELQRYQDHREALRVAWRGAAPAILASNVTVVLSLLTLAVAVIPGNRGLGISSAIGLAIALAAVLLVLPPVLALCGRKIFWPFVPKADESAPVTPGVWRRAATAVVGHPIRSLVAGLLILGAMATGLLGASVGLSQVEKFRVPSESAAGLTVLSAHFPPGEAQPTWVVARADHADEVARQLADLDHVVRAMPVGTSTDGTWAKIMVVGEPAPGTPESLALVEKVREVSHAVSGADAVVGGATAIELDARAGNQRDLLVIAPMVLAVSLLVLVILLRAVVAPVLLLLVNVVSAAGAIGLGSLLSRVVLDQHALDLQVPLLAFLFLVALGIDYTIFLVHRIRHEVMTGLSTPAATVEAVSHTGAVITSAGIVLAAVFAALGVLPLVTLGQLGLIVGVGVVIDTVLVRTVIVPALFGLLKDRMWWPGRPIRHHLADSAEGNSAGSAEAEHPVGVAAGQG